MSAIGSRLYGSSSSPIILRKTEQPKQTATPQILSAYLKKEYPSLPVDVLDDSLVTEERETVEYPALDLKKTCVEIKDFIDSVEVEGTKGATVILLRKGETFQMVRERIAGLNGGRDLFRYVSQSVIDTFGNEPIQKSEWVVITNNIIKGSCGLRASRQGHLLNTTRSQIPGLVALAMLAVARSRNEQEKGDPTYLFSSKSQAAHSRCRECADGFIGWHSIIGGSLEKGLYVSDSRFNYDYTHPRIGFAAMRVLS